MKESEKKGLLILVIIAVLIIGVIWMLTNNKEENKGGTEKSQVDASQGEYTKVESDGTVVNTSEKLKTPKNESGFEVSDIKYVEKNGYTTLTAKVTNMTGKEQNGFMADIVLVDKEGKEMGRIPVAIANTKIGETVEIDANITESYANAYNFKLEKR